MYLHEGSVGSVELCLSFQGSIERALKLWAIKETFQVSPFIDGEHRPSIE